MTKFALVVIIALGMLAGQLAWEALGLMVEWAGKLVGWCIAQSMRRMIAARQAAAAEEAAAIARKRPAIVRENGRDIEDIDTTS